MDLTFLAFFLFSCTGALLAVALLCRLLKRRMQFFTPLKGLSRRPLCDVLPVVLCVVGLVHLGSTKGFLGSPAPSAPALAVPPLPEEPVFGGDVAAGDMAGDGGLRIAQFSRGATNDYSEITVAWGMTNRPAGDLVYVFGARTLDTFSPLFAADIAAFQSNACLRVYDWAMPTNGTPSRGFYSAGDGRDTDGDGLPDIFESLYYGTDPVAVDTDGDGLPDGREAMNGLNPLGADTDGDGLPDGWEVANGLNPADARGENGAGGDPGHDGLENIDEYRNGTAPYVADTDGDGVGDGAEVGQGANPAQSSDMLPSMWICIEGDLAAGVTKTTNEVVTIPAGTTAFFGIFVQSDEYPEYTGVASEFNDRLLWEIKADRQPSLDRTVRVNDEDVSWDFADEWEQEANGFFPAVLRDGIVYSAGSSNLEVSVRLSAMNVADGYLPSRVILGVFPLELVQANMPSSCGRGWTTDAGTETSHALIPANGVAYITGEPAAPQLTARFRDLPWWVSVQWGGTLVSERTERSSHGFDGRTLAGENLFGDEEYSITNALAGEIIGGRCELLTTVEGLSSAIYPFLIRGKNPLDATARAYIDANVDEEFRVYAWMIAKHESKESRTGQTYNQFNVINDLKGTPNKTAGEDYWGWGMCQIDKGENGTTTAEVYDWHESVASMNATLIDKRRRYNEILRVYRNAYQNDPTTRWFEPDGVTTNVNGTVMSARQWAIMTLYNGAGGTYPIPFPGHAYESTPIHFDPATASWILYTNSKNYVPKVLGDAKTLEIE